MLLSSHQESPLVGERNRVCEIRGYVTIVSRNRLAKGWSWMSDSELGYCGNRDLWNSPLFSPVASLSHRQACSDTYSRRVLTRYPPSHSHFFCIPAVYVAFPHWGFLMPITRCLICFCVSVYLFPLLYFYFVWFSLSIHAFRPGRPQAPGRFSPYTSANRETQFVTV
jgi:hypothetical protein